MEKLFLVQIKSQSISKEEKKALLIAMSMDTEEMKGVSEKVIHDALIRDAMMLYPQYTKIEDKPTFTISHMTKKEYRRWLSTNVFKQKSLMKEV